MNIRIARESSDGAKPGLRSFPRTTFLPSLGYVSIALRIADGAIILLCGWAAYNLVIADPVLAPQYLYLQASALATVLVGLILHFTGAYEPPRATNMMFQVRRVFWAWTATLATLMLLAFLSQTGLSYSRLWAATWGGITVISLIAMRAALATTLARAAKLDRPHRVAVYGGGEQARRLRNALAEMDGDRTDFVGLFDDRAKERAPDADHSGTFDGGFDDLVRLVREEKIDEVLIALPWDAEERIFKLVHQLRNLPVHVSLAPDLATYTIGAAGFTQIGNLPVLRVLDKPLAGWPQTLKHAEDYVLATIAVILISPLLAVIALAVKLDSRGPVLFTQHRRGYNHKNFRIFKFRTQYVEHSDAGGSTDVQPGDPRVTRVGSLLRRFNLDELPQIFNVLLGNMSVVGPRPHSLDARAGDQLYEDIVYEYAARHKVKPGITGWAQVNGLRGPTLTGADFRRRVEYDIYYIENWSLLLDLVILLRTVGVTLFRPSP